MDKKDYLDLIDGIDETIKSIEDGLSRDFCEDEEEFDIDGWDCYHDEETIAYDIGYINGLRWVKKNLCDPLKAQEETIESMMDGRDSE